jgi:hypothetical protein
VTFVSCDHHDARFCVTAYKIEDDHEKGTNGSTSCYTTLAEARTEFAKLAAGKSYYAIYLGRWLDDNDQWEDFDAWPEDLA